MSPTTHGALLHGGSLSGAEANALRPPEPAERDVLGMWLFLATEALFFGVLFFAYALARIHFGAAFPAASRHTNVLLGTANTAVLLTSSFTMALAARATALADTRAARRLLLATAALGMVFLLVKGGEYVLDFREHLVPGASFAFNGALARGAAYFFGFYFVSTGLHAVHLVIGIVLVLAMAIRLGHHGARAHASAVEVTGLYWHFVDIVWVFLYPSLYLMGRA